MPPLDMSHLPKPLAELARSYLTGEADGDELYALDIAADEITYRLRYVEEPPGSSNIVGVEIEWIRATKAEAEARSVARTGGLWPD